MDRKEGAGLLWPFRGELGPRLTQCGLGRVLPYKVASSSIQPFGRNRHEPKTGWFAPFRGGGEAATPSNTASPGPTFTSVPSGMLISIQPIGHNRHRPKIGWGLCPFCWGLGPYRTVAWAEAYFHTKWHLSPSSCLATTDIGQKLGERELGPHLTQSRLGCGLPPYQVVSWHVQTFDDNRHGPKIGGCTPFSGKRWGWAGSPSNKLSSGQRPASVPSGTLIHPAVWPQWTWAENWGGGSAPLFGEGLDPHLTQSSLGKAYSHTKWHLNPCSHLATTDMGRKLTDCATLREGELVISKSVAGELFET